MYRYFLNRVDPKGWTGSIATTYLNLKSHSPEYFRQKRWSLPYIQNGGWHFTWMGGPDRFIQKLTAYSHSECDTPQNRDSQNWYNDLKNYPVVPIDESFPSYVIDHIEHLRDLGLIDREEHFE